MPAGRTRYAIPLSMIRNDGRSINKALAEAIRALIQLITLVVVAGVALLCKLTITGELILMFRHWDISHISTTSSSSFTARKKPSVPGWLLRRCCDHQCRPHWCMVELNIHQKPIAASHRCGSLFFMFSFYSIFFIKSTCKKKAPALLPLLKAAISWREKKYFTAFFDSSNFYTDLFVTDEQKKFYNSSYTFIFILYIL